MQVAGGVVREADKVPVDAALAERGARAADRGAAHAGGHLLPGEGRVDVPHVIVIGLSGRRQTAPLDGRSGTSLGGRRHQRSTGNYTEHITGAYSDLDGAGGTALLDIKGTERKVRSNLDATESIV